MPRRIKKKAIVIDEEFQSDNHTKSIENLPSKNDIKSVDVSGSNKSLIKDLKLEHDILHKFVIGLEKKLKNIKITKTSDQNVDVLRLELESLKRTFQEYTINQSTLNETRYKELGTEIARLRLESIAHRALSNQPQKKSTSEKKVSGVNSRSGNSRRKRRIR